MIGPADMLNISVWKENELSVTVPVRPDGKISVPLLGDVQAAGLSPMQLAGSVTNMLRKYVTDPQVTVIVTGMNSQRVFVLGQVGRPGSIALQPNMTILQAISSAGGLGQFANLKGIFLLRSENGRQIHYPFNYKQVMGGKALDQNRVLQPGDSIVVP
jgi:polysaccharide export outer membrane protein